MSRIFNSRILEFTSDESTFVELTNRYNQNNKWFEHNTNDWDMGPLDSDEQEEITKIFEKKKKIIRSISE